MKTGIIKKIVLGAVAVIASATMTSCAGWWIGSNGWGITQPGPGGINIGISGGWDMLSHDPEPAPGPPPGPPPPPPYGPY